MSPAVRNETKNKATISDAQSFIKSIEVFSGAI